MVKSDPIPVASNWSAKSVLGVEHGSKDENF